VTKIIKTLCITNKNTCGDYIAIWKSSHGVVPLKPRQWNSKHRS